ncbi:MAG: cysteine hydrolase [Oscillospiraceae bacterium]|nr:cysteine hydrolase [Oscillospiraceae bacterium]
MQKLTDKQIEDMQKALGEICDWYHQLKPVTIPAKESALFNIDTNVGFVYEGAMSNPLAPGRVPNIIELFTKASERGVPIVCITEGHDENSLEFEAYPPHCIRGTEEAELIPELRKFKTDLMVYKHSTNGFHEKELKEWIDSNTNINTIVFSGFLTDVCVMEPAVAIKTYGNKIGRKINVVICEPAVGSYNLELGDIRLNHNAELHHLMALKFMQTAGCIIASDIIFE